MSRYEKCPDCGAAVGQLHFGGCDVERCPRCGGQHISCTCILEVNGLDFATLEFTRPDIWRNGFTREMVDRWMAEWGHRRMPWTGEWPGDAECREFGWYARRNPDGDGYVPCDPDDPGSGYDLNRLHADAVWDPDRQRYVLRTGAGPMAAAGPTPGKN